MKLTRPCVVCQVEAVEAHSHDPFLCADLLACRARQASNFGRKLNYAADAKKPNGPDASGPTACNSTARMDEPEPKKRET